jgi:hypothetical protein
LIFTLDPTLIGVFTRMHAPEVDLSSIVAEESCAVPSWSSHDNSTSAMIAFLGSLLTPLMLCTIGKKSKDSIGLCPFVPTGEATG